MRHGTRVGKKIAVIDPESPAASKAREDRQMSDTASTLWDETAVDACIQDICSGTHRHIAFMVGSAVSLGMPSDCLGVGQVRDGVLHALRNLDDVADAGARELIDALRAVDRLSDLPFEQFLGCLNRASEDTAATVLSAICGTNAPNTNHLAIAHAARALLEQELADRVSIITTNYDRCLDHALQDVFGVTSLSRTKAIERPAYDVAVPGSQCLRYLKVHGCITEPDTLVFTFSQMMSLITSDGWATQITRWIMSDGGNRPTLGLFVGYGFWDPDLRDWLCSLFAGARLYRNVRPRTDDEESTVTPSKSDSATQHLQLEFFERLQDPQAARCTLALIRSDLVASDLPDSEEANVLTALQARLTGVTSRIPPQPGDDGGAKIRESFRQWSDATAAHFLGKLAYACNRSDGRALFSRTLQEEPAGPRQCDLAHAYLRTYGTANDWGGGAAACRDLRKQRPSNDVAAIAWGYESFFVTLDESKPLPVRALAGAWCLLRGAVVCRQASEPARAVFREYSTHYRAKALQTVWQIAGWRQITRIIRPVVALLASWQARRFDRHLKTLLAARDLEVFGDATALLAELTIVAGDAGRALEHARTSRILRTIVGRGSNAIQGDRLLGWAWLASGTEGWVPAVRAFARGLTLATRLHEEPSIARKMGANLLRLAPESAQIGWPLLGATPIGEEVREACGVLQGIESSNRSTDVMESAWQSVALYVFDLFAPNQAALWAELKRSEWQREPIYLPLCEPKTAPA